MLKARTRHKPARPQTDQVRCASRNDQRPQNEASQTTYFNGLLGFGGLWTQVVQPAYHEIEELNEEHKIMEGALVEAEQTIEEVVASLRDDAPTPMAASDVTGIRPETPTPAPANTTRSREPKELADRLDKVRARMERARARE